MKRPPVFAALLCLGIVVARVEARQPNRRPGDNGPATRAEINDLRAIAVDGSRAVYIAEDRAIRRIDPRSGIITTVQTRMPLGSIGSLVVDATGNLIVCELAANRVRRIDPVSGSVITNAGSTGTGLRFSGDGGPAVKAGLSQPN